MFTPRKPRSTGTQTLKCFNDRARSYRDAEAVAGLLNGAEDEVGLKVSKPTVEIV